GRAVLRCAGPEIGEHPGDVVLGAVPPEAAEEPESVLDDWAADHGIEVPQLLDAVDRLETLVDQVLRQVVALEVVVREVSEEVPAEDVAALFWNDVRQDSARTGLRGQPAGRDGHFLDGAGV